MTQAMALWFLICCGNIIFGVASPLIRVEAQDPNKEVLVRHGGTLAEVGTHDHKSSKDENLPAQNMLKSQPRAKAKSMEKDLCNENYLMGTSGTNSCPGGTGPIHRPTMCADAATAMGLARGREPKQQFEVGREFRDDFPDGCFKANDDAGALWFNNVGDTESPKNASKGTPICRRPKYKNATRDTNDGGCADADGYHKVMDEDECRTFAECLGFCVDEEFRVGVEAVSPAADYRSDENKGPFFDKRPEGCFIHPVSGCVFFNVPKADKDPAGPITGIGVCTVTAGIHVNAPAAVATGAAANATATPGNTTS